VHTDVHTDVQEIWCSRAAAIDLGRQRVSVPHAPSHDATGHHGASLMHDSADSEGEVGRGSGGSALSADRKIHQVISGSEEGQHAN
jgi:hypothetical protein